MSAQHTHGRLHLTSQDDLPTGSASFDPMAGVDTIVLYHDNAKADARRLVACWNACEGMEDPEAEVSALRKDSEYLMASERLRAQAIEQRDELLAALERALPLVTRYAVGSADLLDSSRGLITKVKGGGA